jgi:hypothetical protein
MADKPLYEKYSPQLMAPLFIRVANGLSSASAIAEAIIASTQDEATKEIAKALPVDGVDLSLFEKDLRALLADIEANGLVPPVIDYLNEYMKPSLLMHPIDKSNGGSGTKGYWLSIKDPEAPWLEAVVCYNLSAYIKLFGHNSIKRCPVCTSFFVQGKMKYKFCSEACKRRGN